MSRYQKIDDTVWPSVKAVEDMQNDLRYTKDLDFEQHRMYLASILGAYLSLINKTNINRNYYANKLKKGDKMTDSPKAQTNKKWTSNDKYRDNWDKVFEKKGYADCDVTDTEGRAITKEDVEEAMQSILNGKVLQGWDYTDYKPIGDLMGISDNPETTIVPEGEALTLDDITEAYKGIINNSSFYNPDKTLKIKMSRYQANMTLIELLTDLIKEDGGNQRFSQLLLNNNFVMQKDLGIWVDEFYLESSDLLDRAIKNHP